MCYSALVRKDLSFLSEKFGAEVVTESFDSYLQAVALDSKKYPPMANERIFPGHYAPVVYEKHGKRVIEPMRYGAFPPAFISDPQKYTTYNARRDNLTSKFWGEMLGHHHGVIVIRGFFEWVKVSSLLRAGLVNLESVEKEFARQAESRKRRILEAGKKYKPTPTEQKDPRSRDIIIMFRPTLHEDLIVPVIFSEKVPNSGQKSDPDGADNFPIGKGFALITDTPLPEVSAAGHDRSPILLSDQAASAWLGIPDSGAKADDILDSRANEVFSHGLPLPGVA